MQFWKHSDTIDCGYQKIERDNEMCNIKEEYINGGFFLMSFCFINDVYYPQTDAQQQPLAHPHEVRAIWVLLRVRAPSLGIHIV